MTTEKTLEQKMDKCPIWAALNLGIKEGENSLTHAKIRVVCGEPATEEKDTK